MYVGYCDGQVLFANSRPEEYAITAGMIDVQENAAAQFNFTLPPTNIARELIMPAASIIKVEQDGNEVFRGVLTQYTVDNYGNYVCVAMDLLACLDNVLKAPFAASGVTVNSYVSTLLNDYNDAAGDKSIELGNITVSGSITVNHDEEFVSIFALFKELISEKGGLLRLRYESGKAYLDYLISDSNISAQTITFGKNLIDISSQIDTSTLVSRVYPIGEQGLTIASVNNGKNYLINETVEATYGRIDKTVNVNSDNAATVKSYGQAYLTRYAALKNTITLTAIDLSIIDKALNSFAIGDSVHIISPPHGIDANMPIIKIVVDVVRPSRSTVTLGSTRRTMTGAMRSAGVSPVGGKANVVDSELSDTSENPVQNKVIKAEFDKIADYPVEVGTSGGWTYIKLKSGVSLCWGRYFGNVNAAANNWSGYYYSGEIVVDFPFAFKTLEAINFDGGSNDYLNFARNFASTVTQARFIIAGHSADATNVGIDVSIAAKGRWK